MLIATVSAENVRGLAAIVAGWDKGLAEPGGGARADWMQSREALKGTQA